MVVEDFLRNLKEGVDSINFLKGNSNIYIDIFYLTLCTTPKMSHDKHHTICSKRCPFLSISEISLLEHLPYWQRQKQDAIYKVYENNSDQSTSKDTTMALWTGTDDLLNKTKIMTDLPKLQKIKNTKNDDTDGELIELSEQLETATKLPPRIHNTSSIHQASKPANLLPKRVDISDLIDEDGTVRVIPMNQRLAVAQQKIIEQGKVAARKQALIDEKNKKVMALTFPAGFIVDTKAIADKKKFSSIDDSTKKKTNKLHYKLAKENEQW